MHFCRPRPICVYLLNLTTIEVFHSAYWSVIVTVPYIVFALQYEKPSKKITERQLMTKKRVYEHKKLEEMLVGFSVILCDVDPSMCMLFDALCWISCHFPMGTLRCFDVDTTSIRRRDGISTLYRRRSNVVCPLGSVCLYSLADNKFFFAFLCTI